MSNYGMKVSKAGYDVKTTSLENMVFHSDYKTLKIFSSGSGSVTVNKATGSGWDVVSGKSTVEITHNLGYRPVFMCFHFSPLWQLYFDNTSDTRYAAYMWKSISAGHAEPNFACDTTKLYLTFYNPDTSANRTFTYKYHIYYNGLS